MQVRSISTYWKQLGRTENNVDRSKHKTAQSCIRLTLTRVATVSVPIVAENAHAEELGFRDFSSLFLVKENRRQLGNSACRISFIKVSSNIATLCNGRMKRKGVQSPYLYPFRALLGVGRPTADVGLTGFLTPKDPSAIRQDEANKYCAGFLEELPNGLQIAGLNSKRKEMK